jgi:predicted DNA-binding transcriptional regulator AlpA
VINKGLVFNGLIFATYNDRSLYIRTLVRDRPQWSKEHPQVWRTVKDAEREATRSALHETGGELSDVRPEDLPPSKKLSLPDAPSPKITPQVVSNIEDEVTIEGRRYLSAQRVASMLGKSQRTISRWCKQGGGPPKAKVGSKVFFEADKISEWISSVKMAPVVDRHKKEAS